MMKLLQALISSIALSLCAQGARAQERGTKEEAKAMAEAAAAHVKRVGAERAFKDFNTDKAAWTKKDLYVVAFDWAGNCMANGANEKLVGKNLIEMKDQQGRLFTKDLIEGYLELRYAEVKAYETMPHPLEFQMYYSV